MRNLALLLLASCATPDAVIERFTQHKPETRGTEHWILIEHGPEPVLQLYGRDIYGAGPLAKFETFAQLDAWMTEQGWAP